MLFENRTNCFVFVYFALMAGAPLRAEDLSLRETLQIALDQSPEIQQLQRDLEIASMDVTTANVAYLPKLDLNTTHGFEKNYPETRDQPWVSQFGLTLSESLYDGGIRGVQLSTAKLKRQRAETALEKAKLAVAAKLVEQYVAYSELVELLEMRKQDLEVLKKQYEKVSTSYKQGLKTRRDFLRFKAQIGRAELDYNNYQRSIREAERKVIDFLYLPPERQMHFVPLKSKSESLYYSEFKSVDLKSHPEMIVNQMDRDLAEADVQLTRKKNGPEINLKTAGNYASSDYMGTGSRFIDNDRGAWNVMLELNYALFDWGTKRREIASSYERYKQKEIDLSSKQRLFENQLRDLIEDRKKKAEELKLTTELFELERDNYSYIENEYRNGAASFLDFLAGYNDYTQSLSQMVSLNFSLIRYQYKYLYFSGNLIREIEQRKPAA